MRTSEWWEYKIPPVLAIGYATIIKSESSFIHTSPWLLFLLLALAFGAIFAHTINDLTDLKEDIASGKTNRMANISSKKRWIIPFFSFLGGFFIFCWFLFLRDPLSAIIYALPCVSFSLYSFKPFRLKQRGIWGVLADAFGAHVFIGLLMVSSLSFFANQIIDFYWFSIIAIWSLSFGVRGILWHQFYDRENDLKVNLTTFATTISPKRFKKFEKHLIGIELLIFFCLLMEIALSILFIFLTLYLILAFFRYSLMDHKVVIVLNPKTSHLQILMLDFYQVFFPLGILLHATFTQKNAWIILIIHLILFHNKPINIITDCFILFKILKGKIRSHLSLRKVF